MILHLTRDFPPRVRGGLSTAVGNTVAGLAESGIDCLTISFDGWRRKKTHRHPDGQPNHQHSQPSYQKSTSVFRVSQQADLALALKWAKRHPLTLIHVHDPMLWEFGWEIAANPTIPCIHTLHVLAHHQDRLRGLTGATMTSLAQAKAIRDAHAIIAPSPAVATQIATDIPSVIQRLHVARLGIDTRTITSIRTSAPRSLDILFVGRFSDMAGIDELPSLFRHLTDCMGDSGDQDAPRDRNKLTFTIAGGLPDNPRAEQRWRKRLASSAKPLPIELVLRGWLSGQELAKLYPKTNILVAPNRYATFGFAVAEAMAYGVVVCAYGVGGLNDLINNAQDGLLTENTPAELGRGVLSLLNEPTRSREIGRRGQQKISAGYHLARATKELLQVYKSLDS